MDDTCKFKNDFILLSEFAEIRHGPQPILTIPDKGEGFFDISSFSVRVFSTDYQQSSEEGFLLCPDAQVLITDPLEGAYAYVHYFALNDIQARGYLRQYCICYITNSQSKLLNNFEELKSVFSEVTRLYKCGNHKMFGTDLDHRLADIEYSRHQLSLLPAESSPKEYNSQLEDIPESNDSVLQKDLAYILEIMKVLEAAKKKKENQSVYIEIEKNNSASLVSQTACYTAGNSKFYATQDPGVVDLPEQDAYKPTRVMSHVSQRFSRQLRSLAELSSGASSMVTSALRDIHEFYSRPEVVLSLESFELNCISPVSSLLSSGRVPLCNMLSFRRHDPEYHHLLHTHAYNVTNSVIDNNHYSLVDNGCVDSFDSSFIQSNNITMTPLYLETIPRQRGLSIVDPLASPPDALTANKRSQSGLSGYATPETFPTPPDSPSKPEEPDYQSLREEDHSSDISSSADDNKQFNRHVFTFTDTTETVLKQKNGFPFLSSASLIQHSSKHKPGSLLLQYFKDLPELRDIIYCLLIGMPFIIIASPKDMRLVVHHIRALWIFVAGHSRKCQVIPWQETPLTIQQLSEVKLMGLSSKCTIHDNIKGHIAYWDWTLSTLVAPKYTGTILNPILNRTREKKDSSVYLSLIMCVLAELAGKAFLFYHGFCCQPAYLLSLRQPKTPEISAKKMFSVSPKKDKVNYLNNVRIKESDIEIVEYWTDVVRRQQLNEWRTHCSLCHHSRGQESLHSIQLTMKHCVEKICKPKRVTATL